jgi:hypothetical protein
MRTTITSLLSWAALGGIAVAQNGADECANADFIPAGPGAIVFDTANCSDTGVAATNSLLTQCLTISDDVWYVWVALESGRHTFSTCGAANFDTEIAVWFNASQDGTCDNLMPVGCNDDGPGCAGFTSELSVAVTAGGQYFIQIGDSNLQQGDHTGQGTLEITRDNPPPANDLCDTPQVLVGTGNFPYNTAAATTSGFAAPGGCGNGIGHDVFFTWTAPMAGDFRISTCLTSYDTRLSVYSGSDCGATCLVSDDDSCGFQSAVDLLGLSGGETFLIQAGGFGARMGPSTLTIDGILPTGAECTDPIDLGDVPGTFAYDTTGATSSGFNSGGCGVVNRDMFFIWTAPATKEWAFDTCATSYPSTLAVHDGAGCGASCLVGGHGDCGAMSSVRTPLNAGQTVLIQVGGVGPNQGPGTLEISEYIDPCLLHPDDAFEENDNCASAVQLSRGKNVALFVVQADDDWYRISIPALTTIFAQALFTHAEGDVDMHLFDACGGSMIDQSITSTNDEQVSFHNATAGPIDIFLRVEIFVSSPQLCNEYELVLSHEVGQPGLTYCPAQPNSTGLVAQMTASGSSSVSADDLILIANPIPPNVHGVFINSGTRTQVPFGTKFRCVANPFFRSRVVQAQGTVLSFPVDNQILGGIFPGASRYFQAWFRDTSDPDTFGLSNGYAVTFTQ